MAQSIMGVSARFARDYNIIQWIVYIFIGSAITAFVAEFFVDNYFEAVILNALQHTGVVPSDVTLTFIVVTMALLFVTPLALSMLLTKLHPEKRLVPPLLMQILAFGWLLIYSYNRGILSGNTAYTLVFFGGYYMFFAGMLQDVIMVKAFGRVAKAEDIATFSYNANAGIEKIRSVISEEKDRKSFGFGLGKSEKRDNGSFLFRTSKINAPQVTIELKQGNAENESIINLAVYRKDRYS